MTACWNTNANQRPRFKMVGEILNEILSVKDRKEVDV